MCLRPAPEAHVIVQQTLWSWKRVLLWGSATVNSHSESFLRCSTTGTDLVCVTRGVHNRQTTINKVNLCQARSVPRWVTVSGLNSHYRTFIWVCNQSPRPTQPSILPGSVNWGPASAGKKKAGMVHFVSRWTRAVQVKLWDPLRTIPERLTGVFTTRRYANPGLPLPLHGDDVSHQSCCQDAGLSTTKFWLKETNCSSQQSPRNLA